MMKYIALVLALSLLPATAFAQSSGCQYLGGYPWQTGGCLVAKDLNDAIAGRNPLLNFGAKPHSWISSFNNGEPVLTQPSFADLSGTLPPSMIPPSSATSPGGVYSYTSPASQFMYVLDGTGHFVSRQPSFLDVAGVAAPTQLPFPAPASIGGVKSYSAPAGQFLTGVDVTGTFTSATPPAGGGGSWSGGTIDLANPTVSNDTNNRFNTSFNVTYTNTAALNTGFTDANNVQIVEDATFGLNSYANGTNAKWTFIPLNIVGNYVGHGQRFVLGLGMNCWGNGDCFGETKSIGFWGADIAGDEGQGFQAVSYLSQGGRNNNPQLSLTTITAIPTSTTCNTTLTQAVVGGSAVQAVSVASLTGCAVGDWIAINSAKPTNTPNYEAVQITAVGAGKISGIFRLNQSTGATVRPAKLLTVNDAYSMGQGRMLVNTSAAGYSTGTVSAISGGGFTGSGTAWSNTMVGDNNTPNIGCIYLTADDYSSGPFGGSGVNGTLHSWYAINGVSSTTALSIFTTSTAGDAAYHGYGPGSGSYSIKPCSEVLQVSGNTLVLAPTSATWAIGNTVEQAITPFPDVTGHSEHYAVYTAGGALRSAYSFTNTGRRTIGSAVAVTANMPSGSDAVGWEYGFDISSVRTGLLVQSSSFGIVFAGSANNNTDISWGPSDPTSSTRNVAIGNYNYGDGYNALMLHAANGTGRCADMGAMCLGLQNPGYGNNYWADYGGWFALHNNHNGSRETRFRFYDSATTFGDPSTATSYADLAYAYPGSTIGDYHGLVFTDGTTDILKLDIGNKRITTIADQSNTGKISTTKQITTGTYFVGGVATGLTATGTALFNALQMAVQTNIVTSADSTAGVFLPPPDWGEIQGAIGVWIDIYNDGPANSFHVYALDATIDGINGNTGVLLSNGFWARYVLVAMGQWKSYRFPIVRSS